MSSDIESEQSNSCHNRELIDQAQSKQDLNATGMDYIVRYIYR